MAYADYVFYQAEYLGNAIQEEEFPRLAARASEYLDSLGAQGPERSLSMAACAVAEVWRQNEQGGELSSQTVGPWTQSYATTGKSAGRRLYEAATRYLPLGVAWV